MAHDAKDTKPAPFWRVPPHVARELAARINAAGDDLTGVDIRVDTTRYGEPMTFDVRREDEPEARSVVPLNDTFKCPPVCG